MCTVQAALNRPAKRGAEMSSPPPRSSPASPLPTTTPIKQEAAAAPFGDSGTAAGGGGGSMEDMASSLTPERVDSWGIIKASFGYNFLIVSKSMPSIFFFSKLDLQILKDLLKVASLRALKRYLYLSKF